jgi:hypothetical protein
MADLTETVVHRGGMRGSGLKYLVMEVESATAGDTVTVGDLNSVKDTIAFRLDTGAEVDCMEATNVVTVGAGPSSTPMLIIVSGW